MNIIPLLSPFKPEDGEDPWRLQSTFIQHQCTEIICQQMRHSYEQAGYTHTQRSNSWLTWTVKQLLICVLFVDHASEQTFVKLLSKQQCLSGLKQTDM